jgi:hypothetical protein
LLGKRFEVFNRVFMQANSQLLFRLAQVDEVRSSTSDFAELIDRARGERP